MSELFAQHGWLIIGVFAAGYASGFAGGLFGIGGGIVTVPALYAVFASLGVAEESGLKTAIGTSLAVIIVTSARSLSTHHRAGHVDMRILLAWAPWIAVGSIAGGIVARWITAETLSVIFAAGALYIGWRRLFGTRKRDEAHEHAGPHGPDLTDRRVHIPMGFGAGLFSSLMGLGGGAVGVMVMTWSGRSIHQAVATAAGFGVAVAVPGTIGFILAGLPHHDLPAFSWGYVNLPAFATMAAMSAIAAPMGARLAHNTSGELLSKLFGGYVLLAALGIVFDIFHG